MGEGYEAAVARQIHRLRRLPLPELERAASDKRVRWVEQQVRPAGAERRVSPAAAYELFFAGYLGLDLAEVPVVERSAERIVWRSFNPCPTLQACQRLGLDTRVVCRGVYEGSTQAFLSALDPALRFGRSYEQIRPHAPFCEEWIVRREPESGD